MVVERLVFQVKYGKDLVSVAKKGEKMFAEHGYRPGRVLTDLTGDMFTVVFENEWENLAEFEKMRQRLFELPEFQSWFAEMEAVTEHGHRELERGVTPGPAIAGDGQARTGPASPAPEGPVVTSRVLQRLS